MYTFEQTKAGYAHLWDAAKISSTHTDAEANARKVAEKILGMRATFEEVEKSTSVPWWWVAATLYREADLNLSSYLGNGQSLSRVTTEVPAGRGPFPNFLAGAVDAIQHEGMPIGAHWTVELALYWWERFNGFGYYSVNTNSPYVWNWTNLYNGGKYVADHQFDRNTWDVQGGCAAILKELMILDPTIALARDGAVVTQKPPEPTLPPPTDPNGAIIDALRKLVIDRPAQVSQFVAKVQADLQAVLADINKFNASISPTATPTKGSIMNPITSSPITSMFGGGALLTAVWQLVQGFLSKDPVALGTGVMGVFAGLAGLFAQDGTKK